MKNLNIAFFTEAGKDRGMGHMIRSHTILEEFKKIECNVSFHLDSDIKYNHKFDDIIYFKWNQLKIDKNYDLIFIDSYEADIITYKELSMRAKITVYIDDYNRLDYPKGVILNFSPDADNNLFTVKKEKNKYLLGLKYIPIRNEFLNLKIEKKEQIFIMLGGNDIANLSLPLIAALQKVSIKKIIVVNNKNVVKELENYRNTEVLYQPSDSKLIETMSNSTLAISTASMTAYELSYLNIPTIVIAVAKNQEIGIQQLIQHNIADESISLSKDNWEYEIQTKIKKIINKKDYHGNNNIDGYGASYIAQETLDLI